MPLPSPHSPVQGPYLPHSPTTQSSAQGSGVVVGFGVVVVGLGVVVVGVVGAGVVGGSSEK